MLRLPRNIISRTNVGSLGAWWLPRGHLPPATDILGVHFLPSMAHTSSVIPFATRTSPSFLNLKCCQIQHNPILPLPVSIRYPPSIMPAVYISPVNAFLGEPGDEAVVADHIQMESPRRSDKEPGLAGILQFQLLHHKELRCVRQFGHSRRWDFTLNERTAVAQGREAVRAVPVNPAAMRAFTI